MSRQAISLRTTLSRLRAIRRRIATGGMTKADAEFRYWRERHDDEGTLGAGHYEGFYTEEFGLTRANYLGKRVLDIGCGPRGSLEWADGAEERIGLDPLVPQYRGLGIERHAMTYVASGAESIPFADGYFDIVAAFNALDHVENVEAAIDEMTRVSKPGGIGLVIVEVNHPATPTEPHTLPWDLFERFRGWSVEWEKRMAIGQDHNVYGSFRAGIPWEQGPGLLGGRLRRLG